MARRRWKLRNLPAGLRSRHRPGRLRSFGALVLLLGVVGAGAFYAEDDG